MSKKRSKNYARTKGLQFERTIANELKEFFPDVGRQLEFQKDEAKGIDLKNTGDFKIQCKKYKGYVPINTINEVQSKDFLGEIPVLVTAGTNLPPLVALRFEDFKVMLKAYQDVYHNS